MSKGRGEERGEYHHHHRPTVTVTVTVVTDCRPTCLGRLSTCLDWSVAASKCVKH